MSCTDANIVNGCVNSHVDIDNTSNGGNSNGGNSNSGNDNGERRITGSLSVFTGPMYSGKTSHLIQSLTQHADIYHTNILLINSSLDNRDEEKVISSHSSSYKGISDKIAILSVPSLTVVNTDQYDIIGVDECQFFPDLYITIKAWLKSGKHIYCAGLDSDAGMNIFGQVHQLLHLADRFIKLTAYCKPCLKERKNEILTPDNLPPASFTGRINNIVTCQQHCHNHDHQQQQSHQQQQQIDVGGMDKYQPVCRYHMTQQCI